MTHLPRGSNRAATLSRHGTHGDGPAAPMGQHKNTMTEKERAKFHPSQRKEILALMDRIGGDGHTVWSPTVLEEFPRELQQRFVRTIESDTSDYKSTLFDGDGNVIPQIEAVHGLAVHIAICEDLGIKYGSFMGRGFQARACCEAIRDHFKEKAAA